MEKMYTVIQNPKNKKLVYSEKIEISKMVNYEKTIFLINSHDVEK